MKEKIKSYIKEVDEVDEIPINNLMKELDFLDKVDMTCAYPLQIETKNNLKLELVSKLNLKAIYYKYKAREKWIKEGDKNTKYFHYLTNYRRIINYAEELFIGNSRIEGNSDMRDKACLYF